MFPSYEYDDSEASCDEESMLPTRLYPKKTTTMTSTTRVQKRFHFALYANEVFPIPHIDDLSEEEVRDTWYERADYEKMKTSMIPLIRLLMKGEVVDETDRQTARGLEFRTRKGAIRRQHNKVESISTVLEEQERQVEQSGFVDEERLAEVYMRVNGHCQVEAHQLALGDVEPARVYLSDISAEYMRKQQQLLKQKKQQQQQYMVIDNNKQQCDDLMYDADDTRFVAPERKKSFGKLLRQMRIRRRPTLTGLEATEDRPPVLPVASRPITGSAA
jgi:hypothetical protein